MATKHFRYAFLVALFFTCILDACAQTAEQTFKPRRGGKVTRIHADKLVIPMHHRKNAVDMRTGQAYVPDVCGNGCPPPWMQVIDNLSGLNPNVTEPLCEFTNVISPCSEAGTICRNEPVTFTCCPTQCMLPLSDCYLSQMPEHLCVPKSMQPWLQTLFKLNIWG